MTIELHKLIHQAWLESLEETKKVYEEQEEVIDFIESTMHNKITNLSDQLSEILSESI